MTTVIPSAARRSPFLLDWNAAACLEAPEQSLNAITGQAATFSRASTKTAFDANGVVRVVPHSLPAFQWSIDPVSGLSVPGVLLEDAVVNLVLQSEDWSTTWAAIGTPTRVAASNTAAGVSLDTIGDDAAGTLEGYSQTVTFTATAAKAISVFVKKDTSTSSVIRVRDTTAGADRLLAAITWAGSVPVVTMTTGTYLGMTIGFGGVYRLWFQTTVVTAANTNSLQFYPATNAALTVASTGAILAGGMQAENSYTPGCYLKTTTGGAAKVADAFSLSCNAVPQAMTVYLKMVDLSQAVGLSIFTIGSIPTAEAIAMTRHSSGPYQAVHYGVASPAVNGATVPAIGGQTEARYVLNADGSIAIGISLNGAAETTASDATISAIGAAFSGTKTLTLNDSEGSTAKGFAVFQVVRVAAGVRSLATMRTG